MIRQITVILLLFAFSVQVFNRTAIVLDYYTNTIAYAKNCVNKARPQMNCKGKCQMTKKLKEEESKEQGAPAAKSISQFQIVCTAYAYLPPDLNIKVIESPFSLYTSPAFSPGSGIEIFHPPAHI
jgi:hypothetical protein